MANNYQTPADWMLNDGTEKGSVYLDDRGWVKKNAKGIEEVVLASGGHATVNVVIEANEVNLVAQAAYQAAVDEMSFTVEFNEAVTVTNTPQVSFTVGGGTSQLADYASGTGTNVLTFTIATLGADTGAIVLESIVDNTTGVIADGDANAMVLPFDISAVRFRNVEEVTA